MTFLQYIKYFKNIQNEFFHHVSHIKAPYPKKDIIFHAVGGSIKLFDSYELYKILHKYKPSTVLEIGSFLGFSTRLLLEFTKDWNAEVISVDPNIRHRIFDDPRTCVERFCELYYPHRLEIHSAFYGKQMTDYYYDYEKYLPLLGREEADAIIDSRPIIDNSWGKKFDFIFIDGAHSYDGFMENFYIARNMLNAGGCIAFHDPLAYSDLYKALCQIRNTDKYRADCGISGVNFYRLLSIFSKLLHIQIDGIGYYKLI